MPLSLYDVTVPAFLRAFANLSDHLEKARTFADALSIDHDSLISARLYPDMLPLSGQVQRASDTAKFVPVRLGGPQAPAMPDTEKTFDELQARIAATVSYLKSVPTDAFDAQEDREVVLKFRDRSVTFTGRSYVLVFALPNFYFHATTAYDLLRQAGVPVGKRDFTTPPAPAAA